jgi:hypothetical protein
MIKVTFTETTTDSVTSKDHFFTSNRKATSFVEAYLLSTMRATDSEIKIVKTALLNLTYPKAEAVFNALFADGDYQMSIATMTVNG